MPFLASLCLHMGVGILLCVVQNPAELSIEPKSPHVLLFDENENRASALTPLREWELPTGHKFKGQLLRWTNFNGVVVFRSESGFLIYYPLRQFTEDDQSELGTLLADVLKEVSRLRSLPRLPLAVQFNSIDDQVPRESLPLDYRNGYVYWVDAGKYFRSSDSAFSSSVREALQVATERMKKFETWDCNLQRMPLLGQLIGRSDNVLVFRGWNRYGVMVEDIEYLLPMHFLTEPEQVRASKVLESMPNGGEFDSSKIPKWWIGLDMFAGEPKQPIAFEGGILKVLQPDFGQWKPPTSESDPKVEFRTMEFPVQTEILTDEGLFFVRRLLERQRILTENPDISPVDLESQLNEFGDKLIDANPIRELSPLKFWSFRDCPADNTLMARVIGEQGDHFVFRAEASGGTFWVLKSEVPERQVSYCNATVKRLNEYYSKHPESQPNLSSKFRLVRQCETKGLSMVCEPVSITQNGYFELRLLPEGGQASTLSVNPSSIHRVDLSELKLLVEGNGRNWTAPQFSMFPRKNLEVESQLKDRESTQEPWLIVAGNAASPPLGFQAAINRRYQDSYVFRLGEKEFLVDESVLTEASRAKAEIAIAKLDELRVAANSVGNEKVPVARFWGITQRLLIGSNVEFKPDGSVGYLDLEGQEATIGRQELTNALIAEIRTQLEADVQVRSKQKILEATEMKRLAELKDRWRKEFEDVATATSMQAFELRDIQVSILGTFEKYDGDDVILRDEQGNLVRVFRFAFQADSLDKMNKIEGVLKSLGKESQTPGLDSKDVKLRLLRGSKMGSLFPGVPIRFDRRNLYVEHASGGFGRYDVNTIHRKDMAEVRSMLYLAANSLERDTGINERLKQTVKPEELVRESTELSDKWKRRLDQLSQPRIVRWEKSKVVPKDAAKIIAVSPDGSHVFASGRTPQVIRLSDGKSVDIDSQSNALSSMFVVNNNQALIGFDGEKLRQWDSVTGKSVKQYDQVGQKAIASCQSADSQWVFLLVDSRKLYVVDTKAQRVHFLPLSEAEAIADRPALWCSANGDRFIARSGRSLEMYRRNSDDSSYAMAEQLECRFEDFMVAFAKNFILIADRNQERVLGVGQTDGRSFVSEIGTGLLPSWLGVEVVKGEELVHVIGKRRDAISQAAPYYFSAYIGLDRRVAKTVQSIDVAPSVLPLFAASGLVAVAEASDGWEYSKAGAISESQFSPLDDFARDMIEENDLGQIDSAWKYLRRREFQQLGEFPDQAAEHFLEYMGLHVAAHKWQHGGDLEERAELLLRRWKVMAPDSMFVQTLTAIHQRRLAWEARGSGFADTVTKKGAEIFEQKMRAVAASLKPILRGDDPPTRAYCLAYDVAMSLGLSREVTKKLNDSMMKTPVSSSTTAHAAMVLLLLPRWHGNPGDSERYICATADALGGQEGDRMYAKLMLYAANYYPADEPASKYLEYDADRIFKGLSIFYDAPNSAESFQQALNLFAVEGRWDLYKRSMELRAEKRIFQDDTTIKTLEKHLKEEQMAMEAK